MDLFGEQLKEIRLEKKYSIDQIARETKISRKYLEAIENNEFSVFPSETYLIGFLRSYTEYLGLDSAKYINLYRNYKIQEQPIPINELLNIKKRLHPGLIVLLVILGIAVVAVSSIFIYNYIFNKPAVADTKKVLSVETAEETTSRDVYFRDEVNTEWFSKNDRIIIPLGEQEYTIEITDINEPVMLNFNDQEFELTRDKEVILNLNNDDNDDIRLKLNAIEEREEQQQANLGLYKITAAITSTMSSAVQNREEQPGETEQYPDDDEIPGEEEPAEEIVSDATDTVVIFESENDESFVINITFKGDCLFRYLQDNKNRYQKFYLKDKKLNIEVNKTVTLWISNAGSVDARISGKKISFGRAGQVVTKLIQWRQDPGTQKYRLEVSSIY